MFKLYSIYLNVTSVNVMFEFCTAKGVLFWSI